MNTVRTRKRRGVALVLAVAMLALGLTISNPAPPAVAQSPSSDQAVQQAAAWIARELKANDYALNGPAGPGFPDWGLTIDALFALAAAGVAGDVARATAKRLWEDGWQFVQFSPANENGGRAKLAAALQLGGYDPTKLDVSESTDYFGVYNGAKTFDLLEYVRESIEESSDGRAGTATNHFGQTWAIIALSKTPKGVPWQAVKFLESMQCKDANHPNYGGMSFGGCGNVDGDASGFMIQGLLAAGRKPGNESIDLAVRWMEKRQNSDGSFAPQHAPELGNSNSTGLVGQAAKLVNTPASRKVAQGADKFIRSLQVTCDLTFSEDESEGLTERWVGALAYSKESFEQAQDTGIGPNSDTWVRAGTQAIMGLGLSGYDDISMEGMSAATPAPCAAVESPDSSQTPGQKRSAANKKAVPPGTAPKDRSPVTPKSVQLEPASATQTGGLAAYLAGMLTDGDHIEVEVDKKTYVDYDMTADVVLALFALDEQRAAARRGAKFLLHPDSVAAYAHGKPYEKSKASYAEPLAKLQVVGQFLNRSGKSSRALSKRLDRLASQIADLQHDDGTFTDTGQFADKTATVSRHAWATIALVAAGDADGTTEAMSRLHDAQCDDGLFAETLAQTSCDEGDIEATAAALRALNARSNDEVSTVKDLTSSAWKSRFATDDSVNEVPASWAKGQASAITTAGAALQELTNGSGVVVAPSGRVKFAETMAAADGRQAIGLGTANTSEALKYGLGKDGGFKIDGKKSDLAVTVQAAQAISSRSWVNVDSSPIRPAMQLPLADRAHESTVALQSTQHRPWKFVALGVLFGLILGLAGFVLGRLLPRGGSA